MQVYLLCLYLFIRYTQYIALPVAVLNVLENWHKGRKSHLGIVLPEQFFQSLLFGIEDFVVPGSARITGFRQDYGMYLFKANNASKYTPCPRKNVHLWFFFQILTDFNDF